MNLACFDRSGQPLRDENAALLMKQQEVSHLALRSVDLLGAPKNEFGDQRGRKKRFDLAFGEARASHE